MRYLSDPLLKLRGTTRWLFGPDLLQKPPNWSHVSPPTSARSHFGFNVSTDGWVFIMKQNDNGPDEEKKNDFHGHGLVCVKSDLLERLMNVVFWHQGLGPLQVQEVAAAAATTTFSVWVVKRLPDFKMGLFFNPFNNLLCILLGISLTVWFTMLLVFIIVPAIFGVSFGIRRLYMKTLLKVFKVSVKGPNNSFKVKSSFETRLFCHNEVLQHFCLNISSCHIVLFFTSFFLKLASRWFHAITLQLTS